VRVSHGWLCLYRDGADSVAWHGDTIGRSRTEDTIVAIVSLGTPRRFLLRPERWPSQCFELGEEIFSSWRELPTNVGTLRAQARARRWTSSKRAVSSCGRAVGGGRSRSRKQSLSSRVVDTVWTPPRWFVGQEA